MTIEEIRNAMIGKRLQTLYHGRLQTDWGKVVNVEYLEYSDTYRVNVDTEIFGQYLSPEVAEALCKDGIAVKPNEWGKHYRLKEIE